MKTPVHAVGPDTRIDELVSRPDPHVVVVLSAHVGRNLFCTPAIGLIRRKWREARITALAGSPRGADALQGNPHIDEIRVGRSETAILRAAAHAELVVGLCRSGAASLRHRMATPCLWIGPLPGREHRASELLHFVEDALGVRALDEDRHYVLRPGEKDHATAAALLPEPDDWRWIGLHLGSGRTQAHGWKFWYPRRAEDGRLWPLEGYRELARRLTAMDPHTRFVLTGSRAERFLANRFSRQIPHTVDLVGRTSLLELAAVMTRLSGFVSSDTGPMHVAAAMNTPLVALFGPTDPIQTGPYPSRPHHQVIRAPRTPEIEAGAVAAALERLLLRRLASAG